MASAAILLLAGLALLLVVANTSLWVKVRPLEYDAYALIKMGEWSLIGTSDQEVFAAIVEEAGEQPATLETLSSQGVLDPVITRLDLVSAWNLPSMDVARTALTGRIKVEPEPGTDLVRLIVRADTTERAVDLANALAENWRQRLRWLDDEYRRRVFNAWSARFKEKAQAAEQARHLTLKRWEELDPATRPSLLEPVVNSVGATSQTYETARGELQERRRDLDVLYEALDNAGIYGIHVPRISVMEAADASTVSPRLNLAWWVNAPFSAMALLLAASMLLVVGVWRLFHKPANRTGR